MKRRKKKVSLPRLTILAMNRRDLALSEASGWPIGRPDSHAQGRPAWVGFKQLGWHANAEPPVKPRMSEERSDTFIN